MFEYILQENSLGSGIIIILANIVVWIFIIIKLRGK